MRWGLPIRIDSLMKTRCWCDADKFIKSFFRRDWFCLPPMPVSAQISWLYTLWHWMAWIPGWPRKGRNQAVQHVTEKLGSSPNTQCKGDGSELHRSGWLLASANESAGICEYLVGTCQCSTVQAASRPDSAQSNHDHGSTSGASGSPWFRYVAYVASYHVKREIQRIQHSSPQQSPRRTGIQVSSAWPSKDRFDQRARVT